ncbi:AGE family epimerase/isomerase [Pseudomonas sp. NPDC089752]|uniref:D-mannose isomerase n=1 Tax=Pseudomonas sp. NPDC089752 TaxID=3364472 RepID=UPI003823DBEF
MNYIDSPEHIAWLSAEGRRLLSFAKAAQVPDGFAGLDVQGALPPSPVADTLITARMTHSFALAHIQGEAGCLTLVEHGVQALRGPLHDAIHGGWISIDGKAAYLHAFIALAASSAVVAGASGAQGLLVDAIRVIEERFWSEEEGALRESFSSDWLRPEAYRGANSNMHATEAFLALADVTGDMCWLERALRIVERIIHDHAAANDYRVVEHFDVHWRPLLDYNRDNPADHFRPYGATPGHAFEWARLVLHLEAARRLAGLDTPEWLLGCARGLFASACQQAWHVDGGEGIVYTLDWDNHPKVRERLHWVHAEACASAAALLRRTGEPEYARWYRCFWDFIDTHFIDRAAGSWHHELDPANRPAATIWAGKPDLYHAYQAVLLPTLPLAPSLATALARNVTKR